MVADDFDFGKSGEPEGEDNGALVSETTYKGKPVLVLKRTPEDKYPFSMGLGKCRLAAENIQVIENFIKKYDKK